MLGIIALKVEGFTEYFINPWNWIDKISSFLFFIYFSMIIQNPEDQMIFVVKRQDFSDNTTKATERQKIFVGLNCLIVVSIFVKALFY
jgi:hypothetical protein